MGPEPATPRARPSPGSAPARTHGTIRPTCCRPQPSSGRLRPAKPAGPRAPTGLVPSGNYLRVRPQQSPRRPGQGKLEVPTQQVDAPRQVELRPEVRLGRRRDDERTAEGGTPAEPQMPVLPLRGDGQP